MTETTPPNAQNNRLYLLRLWRNSPRDGWRVTLKCTATGQQFNFGSVEQYVAYLKARMACDA